MVPSLLVHMHFSVLQYRVLCQLAHLLPMDSYVATTTDNGLKARHHDQEGPTTATKLIKFEHLVYVCVEQPICIYATNL